jgi:hypothetical protein
VKVKKRRERNSGKDVARSILKKEKTIRQRKMMSREEMKARLIPFSGSACSLLNAFVMLK